MNAPFPPVAAARVRSADAGDDAAIAAWLAGRADATPFHLPGWSRAVEAGCGQAAHYLVAERGGAIAGVLPLTAVRSRLFGAALVSAGFAVDGGILADDAATADALAAAGWALAGVIDCPSLELRGGWLPGDGWHVEGGRYARFVRPLAADAEAELKAIPRKQRAEVRKALDMGFETRVGRGRRDLADHHRVYSESVRNLGTPVFPRALFAAALERLDADILTILHRGRPVASVLSLYFAGTVYPYWGGGTLEARSSRANEAMYYALMNHARGRGCTRFDFGRSKLGTGAFAYKKNWGFVPEPLAYAVRTADGAAPRAINPLDPKYRLKIAAWQKLPLWLANRIGPAIARGLG